MKQSDANHTGAARGLSKFRWIAAIMVLLLIVTAWSKALDRLSQTRLDEAFVQASAAFVAARGLNALISVAQSATAPTPIGMVSWGEFLDPANDLVEQYSSLMKFSLGSLVVQFIILDVVSSPFFSSLLSASGLLILLTLFGYARSYRLIAFKVFGLLIFARFAFVLVVVLNALVVTVYIEEQRSADVEALESVSAELEGSASASDLSAEERSTAEAEIANAESELQEIEADLATQQILISESELQVQEAESELGVINASISLADRLLNRSEERNAAVTRLGNLRTELSELRDERRQWLERQTQLSETVRYNENLISGTPNSFLARVRSGWNSTAGQYNPIQIADRVNSLTNSAVRVMSLFLLETLIMPLFFLYVFSKGLKLVWRIDKLSQNIGVGTNAQH